MPLVTDIQIELKLEFAKVHELKLQNCSGLNLRFNP